MLLVWERDVFVRFSRLYLIIARGSSAFRVIHFLSTKGTFSLPNQERARVSRSLRFPFLIFLLTAGSAYAVAQAGTESPFYSRVNTFGVFGAYSPDSSAILLGVAENRKLVDIGVSYGRRLFLNHAVNWQYNGELLPVALESDPVAELTVNQTSPTVTTYTTPYGPVVTCAPQTAQYNITLSDGVTYTGSEVLFCSGRRWVIGEGMSPVGFQWNFVPRHPLQPFFIGHGGYMYSTKPIPITDSGAFNFTFDLGAGLEFFQSHKRSIRAEFRYHHISNHNTADENPGVDNLLYQVTYAFGR